MSSASQTLFLEKYLQAVWAINQSVLLSDRPIKGEADRVRVQRNPAGKALCVRGSLLLLHCERSKDTLLRVTHVFFPATEELNSI